MIVQEFNLNMIPDSEPVVVHVNQYDTEDGRFVIHLYNGDTPYTPTNATVLIEGCKPDGNVFAYGPSHGVSISGNTVTAPCLIQMTAVKGRTMTNLIVKENGASTGTFVFWLDVQETPLDRAILSETEIPVIVALAEEQAERAEAWAVGEKNGHPVPDTDPTFDNNAKYWAEQAASSVTGVASFNGRGGSVLPMAGDYNSDMIPHTMSSSIQPIGGIQPSETVMTKRIINALTKEVEANTTKISTKADKTDLTSIIATGSTNATGSTITKGTYFYLNGVFVKALSDIASGATFTLNTNYEVVTAGGLNDISSWKYIPCVKTELIESGSASQSALSETPPANLNEYYIEFEIASAKKYAFFAPKGGTSQLIEALNNSGWHIYAYGSIQNDKLQCNLTSKGTGYANYPFYVTGMYYR